MKRLEYFPKPSIPETGFVPGDSDGQFGPRTAAAAKAFQLANGLLPDGEVGVKTAEALGAQWIT